MEVGERIVERLVVKGTKRIRFGGDLLSTVWTGPVLMRGLLETFIHVCRDLHVTRDYESLTGPLYLYFLPANGIHNFEDRIDDRSLRNFVTQQVKLIIRYSTRLTRLTCNSFKISRYQCIYMRIFRGKKTISLHRLVFAIHERKKKKRIFVHIGKFTG